MAVTNEITNQIRAELDKHRKDIFDFLREIVAIPSYDRDIGAVANVIGERMSALGFDEIRFDAMGNILGRIGNGPRKLLFDSHIDTVGIGDPEAWKWDPFKGKIEDGKLWGRGTVDEKGSTPPMIYAMAVLKRLGLAQEWTLYYFGNMEEWCDGIAPNVLVEVEGIRPDYVVIGEPTNMRIYRGHRGRIEISVTFKGRSCHASAPERGINPVYKAAPFISGVQGLQGKMKDHPFLGRGSIAITYIECKTPSLNAVPDECSLYIDRRITVGETKESVLEELKSVPSASEAIIEIPIYDTPAYNGFVFPVEKVFPAWVLEEDHLLVRAGMEAYRRAYGKEPETGKWVFSTNGTYWMGKAGIPCIGFGPGLEEFAHQVDEHIPIDQLEISADFYAHLPLVLSEMATGE